MITRDSPVEPGGPRCLVLGASQSSTNFGVKVLADGTTNLARALGAVEVDTYNFGDIGPGYALTTKNLAREAFARGTTSAWLAQYDLVLDTGIGDSFAEIYGWRRLAQIGLLRRIAVKSVRQVVLSPQTIGPFNSLAARNFAKFSLRGVRAVMTRDKVSGRYAKSRMNLKSIDSTDVVFLLSREPESERQGILFNVSGLLWRKNTHIEHLTYQRIVKTTLAALAEMGENVTLLAHVHGGDTNDDDAAAIHELLDGGFALQALMPQDLAELRHSMAKFEVVVGSRMHACLNALSLGVPTLPLAYSRKFAPLFEDLGWDQTLDLRNDISKVDLTAAIMQTKSLSAKANQVNTDARSILADSIEHLATELQLGPR